MPWVAEQYQEAVYRHHLMLQGRYAAMISGQAGGVQQSAYLQSLSCRRPRIYLGNRVADLHQPLAPPPGHLFLLLLI